MEVPPIKFDLSYQRDEPPLPRMQWVWVAFACLFIFIIGNSLNVNDKKSAAPLDSPKMKERSLELKMCAKGMMPDTKSDRSVHLFEQEINDLLVASKKDSSAQKLRVVLRVEDNDAPFRDDLTNLAKSTKPANQAFSKLYTEPKPKKEESLALLKQIGEKEISERIAAVQIKESFGDKTIRNKTFDPQRTIGSAILAMLGVIGLGIGMLLWYIYFFQRQLGRLLPKGLPMANIDWGKADRLVFVALVVFLSFALARPIVGLFFHRSGSGIDMLLYLPVFVAMVICLNVPIFGWRIPAKSFGLSFEKFPEKVGWAFAAFFANIPILFGLLMITAVLTKFLPGGYTPVTEELNGNVGTSKSVALFFVVSVLAPIWEEFFFRGLLLPALTKALGKPIYGALLSSFVFASIHPQGMLGIPLLMGVGMVLCAVSYQTKSLVSNMILHGLHNGATILVVLVMGPLLS